MEAMHLTYAETAVDAGIQGDACHVGLKLTPACTSEPCMIG